MINLIFELFLLIAVWQDIRDHSISMGLCLVFGCIGILLHLWNMGWSSAGVWGAGSIVGLLLLGVGKLTRGAVGLGDGLFFCVSGIYLGLPANMILLMYGLLFCSLFCLVVSVIGAARGKSMRKKMVPFLPFLLPPGLWLLFL